MPPKYLTCMGDKVTLTQQTTSSSGEERKKTSAKNFTSFVHITQYNLQR